MRVIRPLFICLTILLLFSNLAFSQSDSPSSIYHDSKVLSDFLENYPAPMIHFNIAGGNSGRPIITKDDQKVEIKNEKSLQYYNLTSYGYYRIGMSNPKYNDTINISVNDTILQILPIEDKQDEYSKSIDSLDAIVIGYYPSSLGIIVFKHTKVFEELGKDENGKPIFEIYQDPPYSNHIYESGKSTDEYTKILNILTAQSGDLLVDKDANWSFTNLQSKYLTNPFLNNLNRANPLFDPSVDIYFSPEFSKKFTQNFSQNYYSNYPYHKLLYGDSILSFQKTVSFKDASISYRKQITTSQNELTDASIRINETNKRKNLLDAKTVAVGLSDFIAERAQEELNLTFFNRFKENLNKPSELTVLFPNTKNLLYQFEISNYKTLLSHARESFKVDLDNLGLNFPEILKLKKYQNLYNSPEVFNLSLIYSIADLAYKEEPVENILVAAFQKLKDRKIELNKSINAEIADNLIAAVTPTNRKKSSITSKQIKNNEKLQRLKIHVEDYLNAIENCQDEIRNFQSNIYLEVYLDSSPMLSSKYPNNIHALEDDQDNINLNETNIRLNRNTNFVAHSDFFRPIQYNNRIANESSLLDFYKKTIGANLDGKEYYGYLIDNPQPGDYQIFFQPPPDSIHSVLAEGIEGCRNMLAEDFEKEIDKNYFLSRDLAKIFRKITMDYFLRQEKLAGPEKKIIAFSEKVKTLKSSIEHEISFWEKTTQLDRSDHHIAGLYFLKSLMEKDIQIKLFEDVANLLESGNEYNKLVEDFYGKTLKEDTDYQRNMNLALNHLDSLQFDFEDKINLMVKDYGSINFSDSTYQHQKLSFQLHLDTISINEKYNISYSKSLLERVAFNTGEFHGLTNDEISFLNEENPLVVGMVSELFSKNSRMKELGNQLNELNKQLETQEDEAEKENIKNQIIQLNDQRDQVEMEIESTLDANFQQLEDLKNELLAKSNSKKTSLIQRFNEQVNSLGKSSSKPLHEFYSLNDNPYFKKYKNLKEYDNEIDFSQREEMFNIKYMDQQLDTLEVVINELKEKRLQFENYFTYLDTTYCNNLVGAHENASNLAKSLEFSAHLLFAFRDYEQIYDTVFVYDSTQLSVTINQLDTLTGFTNTITRDSLFIKRKPIDGTTNPLVEARWITRKEFDDLRGNELQWNIFLGLLYQRLNSIENAPNFSAEGVALLATKFLSITHDMENYRSELRRKKATTPDLVTFKDYYPFIRSTVDLFNTVITTPSVGDTSLTISKKFGLQNIPQISNEALSLYENIYVKEYGNAVLNTMELLKLISNKKLGKKEARKAQRSINAVLTYGTFMANMINAQTSDQVKNILKSATLPPGSSRIKRETVSSFTINSYLGAAVGRDRLLGVPENIDLAQDAFGASLSVPIGFTYSFSPNIIKNNSSFSIHVPLIDLGAITAYRQNPDNPNYSIDDLPDFSWQNLFSPGVFAVYNFADSPFSLGVGGQYGPQLRQITPTGGEAINVNSWRFPMAFFTIDVPFFNLHTGARKIIVD